VTDTSNFSFHDGAGADGLTKMSLSSARGELLERRIATNAKGSQHNLTYTAQCNPPVSLDNESIPYLDVKHSLEINDSPYCDESIGLKYFDYQSDFSLFKHKYIELDLGTLEVTTETEDKDGFVTVEEQQLNKELEELFIKELKRAITRAKEITKGKVAPQKSIRDNGITKE
jgi:hypothetical protein